MAANSNIPPIRTFQMDASTAGNIKSSVNLCRGDVNLNKTLFTIPGKRENDGLEVNVSLQYQSNIELAATTWNREQPTGIVGLGWDIPNTFISLDDVYSVAAGAMKYTFSRNGIGNRLIREPQNPKLFTIAGKTVSKFKDAIPIPEEIVSFFADYGIAVSQNSILSKMESGWLIKDDGLQQEFLLVADKNNNLAVFDGGESYQPVNYSFWKFIYYPDYERWAVTTDSGIRLSFGGISKETDKKYKTGMGNSIEWGVLWTDSNGSPLWKGNSTNTKGQQQYARAWNLCRTYNIWGDYVCYGYNEWPRDDSGLIPEVEKPVGNGGLPYTKACYLTSITDVFGRKAIFNYGSKIWNDAIREYNDPHKPDPVKNTSANGYQDRYETKFLDQITMEDHGGNELFSINFSYPKEDDFWISDDTNANHAEFSKRLLLGFKIHNAHGQSRPGYNFEYYTQSDDVNMGALKSVLYPTGGIVTYNYQKISIENCNRTLTITAPEKNNNWLLPKVWFGPDYAVTNWSNSGQLSLQIHTWDGQWSTWQPENNAIITDESIHIDDVDTLSVVCEEDFIVLSFENLKNHINNYFVYIYQRFPGNPTCWELAAISEKESPIKYPLGAGEVKIQTGEHFVLITQTNNDTSTPCSYDLFTQDWSRRLWISNAQKLNIQTVFTAFGEYFASMDTKGNFTLNYLGTDMKWQSGNSINLGLPGNPKNPVPTEELVLRAGEGMVAVSYKSPNSNNIQMIQWDMNYNLTQEGKWHSFDDNMDGNPLPWIPVIVSDSLVVFGDHPFKYNGQEWIAPEEQNHQDYTCPPRYAFGPDYVIRVLAEETIPSASFLFYDQKDDSWKSQDITERLAKQTTKSPPWETANWPYASKDFFIVGDAVIFRSNSDWPDITNCKSDPLDSLNDRLNLESIINQSSRFLAGTVYNDDDTQKLAVFILKNGTVTKQIPNQVSLSESMWTSSEDKSSSGRYPGGANAFAAYPAISNSFDRTESFFLHHYAGDAIEGPIHHYAVSTFTIHDGFKETASTNIEYDLSSACCDSSGEIIKFYKTTVYPGSDKEKKTYGSIENCYINGGSDKLGDYHRMLDGMLSSVANYDKNGKKLTQKSYEYSVYTQRADHPTDRTVPVRNLKGAFVLQTKKTEMEDGLTSSTAIEYIPDGLKAPFTGQPVKRVSSTMNISGITEDLSVEFGYACEVNKASEILNNLTKVIRKANYSTLDKEKKIRTSSSVTAIIAWPSNWQNGAEKPDDAVRIPAEEASFGWISASDEFPFDSYTQGGCPDGWQIVNRIITRSKDGSVIELKDGGGTAKSSLYSKSTALPVAIYSGALLSECAYYGFEEYEDTESWQQTELSFAENEIHTGTRSGCLKTGATLSTSVTPQGMHKTFLLGFWYKTQAGFAPSDSGWTITGCKDQKSVLFDDTNGQWRYKTAALLLEEGAEKLTITATNKSSSDVLLDNILLIPLGSDLAVSVWNPQKRLLTASMDHAGRTTLTRYGFFDQTIASVGPDGQLKELSQTFLSRQGSQNDQFDDSCPNAELTLHVEKAGILETFLDGGQWLNRWSPTDKASWLAEGGVLSNKGGTNEVLSWYHPKDSCNNTAHYVEILPKEKDLTAPLGILFAGDHQILWGQDDTGKNAWKWTNSSGAEIQPPLSSPPSLASQWLLLQSNNGMIQFYGDGQLIFCSKLTAASQTGQFSIKTGGNALSLYNLSVLYEPRLGLSYMDGGKRHIQTQQLHNDGSLAMASIYDPLDRLTASTRTAPITFGSNSIPMRYSSSFVDAESFASSLSSTWKMSGDVADYYAEQDKGYPYRGIRYEDSSRNRQIENSDPGLENAIHDITSTTPEQRNTVKTDYNLSGKSDPVAEDKFFALSIKTAAGYTGCSFSDSAKRRVAAVQYDDKGNAVGQTEIQLESAAGDDNYTQSTIKLPNAYADSQNPNGYTRVLKHNPLGFVKEIREDDSQTIRCLHDGKGKLRFVGPSMDTKEQYYQYFRYDALGRIIEEGRIDSSWNESVLESLINDQSRPNHNDGAVPSRIYMYDGDGGTPCSLGKLVKVVTKNSDPTAGNDDWSVTETWDYDQNNRVSKTSLTVSGAINKNITARYTYNNLNEIISIDFPSEEMPLKCLFYSYDDQGRMTAISTSDSNNGDIASYSYNTDGSIASERIENKLSIAYTYDSKGQLINYSACTDDKALFETRNSYNYDGVVTARSRNFTFNEYNSSRNYSYEYDGQQRLTAVKEGNSQIETITLYDPNGNVLKGSQNDGNFELTLDDGTNRLKNAALADGSNVEFEYRSDGRPVKWRGITLSYDKGTDSMVLAETGTKKIRFGYGVNNHRIFRTDGENSNVKFYGSGSLPLIEIQNDKPTLSIWGPTGLVALYDGEFKIPIKDLQHTVWAWMGSDAKLLAYYDFLPFGTLTNSGGTAAEKLPVYFLGKEYDQDLQLYDFTARLYDPRLLRFLEPDQKRQYASPYVFLGNCPLSFTDPSGNLSLWAKIGLGALAATVALVGIGLTIVTAGASDAAAAEADAAIAGTEMGEIAVEAGSEAAEEVSAGIGTAEGAAESSDAAVSSSSLSRNMMYLTKMAGASALTGAGISGLTYDCVSGNNFTTSGYFTAMGIGLASGAVSGGIGSLATMPAAAATTATWSVTSQIALQMAVQGIGGSAGAEVSTLLADAVSGKKVTPKQMLVSGAEGFAKGAVLGAFSSVKGLNPEANAVNSVERSAIRVSTKINRMANLMKSALPSTKVILAGGGFLGAAWMGWGVSGGDKG